MKLPALLSVALLLALASPARADEARTYFDIGAKAYEAGRYLDAARAFKEAYRLSKRPGLLFSLGQANRMEFFARSDPARLADAVHYYQEYVKEVSSGHHRREATEALATLKPLLANLGGAGTTSASGGLEAGARVMLSSATEGARIMLDGKAVSDPFMGAVAPGKHKVKITAPGYQSYEREIDVDAKTGAPPLDVTLHEKPGRLVIHAPDGADVAIDGRLQGVTPLPPLSIRPGEHFVAVMLNGHEAFSRTITIGRGAEKTVDADLHTTQQRTASWVLLGAGAAGIVAGGVLGYVALTKQSAAQDIQKADTSSGNLPSSQLDRYDTLRQERDSFRLAAVISLSSGVALAGVGFTLRAFDHPRAPLPPAEQGVPGAGKPVTTSPGFEISAAPLCTPALCGAAVRGAF